MCVHVCVCDREKEREETNLIMRIMQLQHACSAGALELFLSFLFLVNFCIANTDLYWHAYVSVCSDQIHSWLTCGVDKRTQAADSHI